MTKRKTEWIIPDSSFDFVRYDVIAASRMIKWSLKITHTLLYKHEMSDSGDIMLCPERGNRYTLKGKIGMKMTQTLDHLSPLDPFL